MVKRLNIEDNAMIKGLNIEDNGSNNTVIIDEGTSFSLSKIVINGNGNNIRLGCIKGCEKLIINLKGDNKRVEIKPSNKFIRNLKLTSIRGDNQVITIGENLSLGGMEIQMNDGDEACHIGDNCLLSWGIKIRTSDGHSVIDLETGKAVNHPKDVLIANRVWVGEDVSFLKGSRILADSVVASKAVVTKSFSESNVVIAGFPASVVKRNIAWDYMKPADYDKKVRIQRD